MRALVTGGAGYIGSHTCQKLKEAGIDPVVYDNLSRGNRDAILFGDFVEGDTRDTDKVYRVLKDQSIDIVLHFAAYAYVKESVEKPEMYFENNVSGSVLLLQAMQKAGVKRLVFSSTCATYGIAKELPISEDHPQDPINPYGQSKLMVEKILRDLNTNFDFKTCALRYFNAAGADLSGRIGECHVPEPHIIPLAIEAALGNREKLFINGTDYPTRDGTCVRDFVHVSDIAQAHVLVAQALLKDEDVEAHYNLSNERGFSILEIAKQVEKASGKKVSLEMKPRRPGDPPELVGNSDRFEKRFGWVRQSSDIESLISSALKWRQSERFHEFFKRQEASSQ
ncbi:MAG: UDP-glucose 4-epimerase GalE [Pseudomonadota bacterium]